MTWSSGHRTATRIDYIMLRFASKSTDVNVTVDYKKAMMLQLAGGPSWIDHAPVTMSFTYRIWFDDP